jgi:DNA-binding PadR family transcriptional regulator
LLTNEPKTGYEITVLFVKKFGILVGPGAIYSKLNVMERKVWIKAYQNRTARTYYLTQEGQAILNNIDELTLDIQKFVKKLLNQNAIPC